EHLIYGCSDDERKVFGSAVPTHTFDVDEPWRNGSLLTHPLSNHPELLLCDRGEDDNSRERRGGVDKELEQTRSRDLANSVRDQRAFKIQGEYDGGFFHQYDFHILCVTIESMPRPESSGALRSVPPL